MPSPERVAALRALPYDAYLETDHWQQTRLLAVEAAGWTCELCFARAVPLQVHHRTYARLGEEWSCDLIAICRPCHEAVHGPGANEAHMVQWADAVGSLAAQFRVGAPLVRAEPIMEEYMDEDEGYMRWRSLPVDGLS